MSGPPRYGNPGERREEVDLVGAIYEGFARRDLAAIDRYLTEDVVLHLQGTARALGRTEPYVGYAGVREYFADCDRVWDDLELFADDIRVIAGSAIVFGHIVARRAERPVRRRVMWTWLLRDGRAASVRAEDLGEV